MIKIAKLATAHMFDENNPEDFDYALWKSIAGMALAYAQPVRPAADVPMER